MRRFRHLRAEMLSQLRQLERVAGGGAVSQADRPHHLYAGMDGNGVDAQPAGGFQIHGLAARHGLNAGLRPRGSLG